MSIVAVIQARTDSTRLPKKILKKIKGKSIIDYVIERTKLCNEIDDIVLATTISKKDDILKDYAIKNNLNFFRGSEDDVLERYYRASIKFNANIIVRITGDCPLIDPEIIDNVIKKHIKSKSDYTANIIKRTYPRGLDVEVFSLDALESDYKNANKKYQREHVTPYIRENPKKFKLQNVEATEKLKRPDIRITVDTKEDFELVKRIILNFDNFNFRSNEIIDFLDRNPELLKINKNIRQKSDIMFDAEIIGEIGSNHMGKINIGEKLIDKCKKNGCSAVKMQLWKADDLYKNTPIYETTKKLELNFDKAKVLFEYAKKKNIDLFFSVFYPEAIDFCETIGVKYYKIAARSINDYKLLKYVADTDKPIFVSFSNEHKYDKNRLVDIFECNQIIQMYTVSKYPPEVNDFDYRFLDRIIFNNGGYSNHYRDLYTCQLSIFLGALWIEVHVMLEDECKTSPDRVCSLTIGQLKELIDWQNKMKLLSCGRYNENSNNSKK